MADSPEPDHYQATAGILRAAAEEAGRAPSILNTQPWLWFVRGSVMDLCADADRRLRSIDPQGRLLTLSCGACLHHARLALAYAGWEAHVARLPDPHRPDLLARVSIVAEHEVTRRDRADHASMRSRRTERRPAPTVRVPAEALTALTAAAEREGVTLHRLGPGQMPRLITAVETAQATQSADSTYEADLVRWTQGHTEQGIRRESLVAHINRTVPLRDFTAGGETLLHPGFGDDSYAEFLVIGTEADEPSDWLRAGEACSAVWLTATSHGLAGSVISDVVEVSEARTKLRTLLGGTEYPQLVLRLAMNLQPTPSPRSFRRPAADFVRIEPPE